MTESGAPGDHRSKILAMATQAAKSNLEDRRYAVKGLVHERYRAAPQTDAPAIFPDTEILEAAYGDPAGAEYWQAWIAGEPSRPELADLLAVHTAEDELGFSLIRRKLGDRLLSRGKQSTREDLTWLLENPNTRHLVPKSLARYLGVPVGMQIEERPEQPMAAPVSDGELRDFCRNLPANDRLTKEQIRDRAKERFSPRTFTVRAINKAAEEYSGKRLQGEHGAKVRRDEQYK